MLTFLLYAYWCLSVFTSPSGSFIKKQFVISEDGIMKSSEVLSGDTLTCEKYNFFLSKNYYFIQFGMLPLGYKEAINDKLSLNFIYPKDKGHYDLKIYFQGEGTMGYFSNQPVPYKIGDTVNVTITDENNRVCDLNIIINNDIGR